MERDVRTVLDALLARVEQLADDNGRVTRELDKIANEIRSIAAQFSPPEEPRRWAQRLAHPSALPPPPPTLLGGSLRLGE
jgi:hypothetical protein